MLLLASCSGGGGAGGGGPTTGGIDWKNKDYGPPDSSFFVKSDSSVDRAEVAQAAVPFGPSQVVDIQSVGIVGHDTSWRVLQRWPDGSVKVGLAQFFDTFEAGKKQTYRVSSSGKGEGGSFELHPWTAARKSGFALIPKVIDDDGVPYYGLISGPGEVLSETKRIRTRRWRTYLYNTNASLGIKRDFLAARFYITDYRDMPFMTIKLVIGNDYQGADNPTSNDKNLYPLGAVSFSKLEVHALGGVMKLRHQSRHQVANPTYATHTGAEVWTLLENVHMDDGATKMWDFEVLLEDPAASAAERNKWRTVWAERADRTLRPLATFDTWQSTDALGLCGGPSGRPDQAFAWSEKEWADWKGRSHFGPFESWGDPKNTHTTGTPRNQPVTAQLGHAIQAENPHMLEVLEGMVTQQACRQYHVWGLEVPQDRDIYMWFGLGFNLRDTQTYTKDHLGRYDFHAEAGKNDPYKNWRRNVPGIYSRGYGWNAFDPEHASVDLLFDHYTVTGDHWTLDEIEMLGQYTRGVWRFKDYYSCVPISSRAEGWVLQLLVAAYVATGNEDYKADVIRRVTEITDVHRHKEHPSKAIFYEKNYPSTHYPGDNSFFAPWQHAAVAIGFTSAYRFCGSTLALEIAEDAIRTAEYSVVRNFTNPVSKAFFDWDMRYYIPVKFTGTYKGKQYTDFMTPKDYFDADPNVGVKLGGGVPEFWRSAAFLVARYSGDAEIQDIAIDIGDHVLGTLESDGSNWWNKWAMSIPTELLPSNRTSK
ncbi:MAG: hypothetical protein KDC95_03360 [Planctomycetes bacterium]|nr:hypothetical protein [Planctomycetota bacterium]